jgi:RimJ/RimL family protein N-acetyltransferase
VTLEYEKIRREESEGLAAWLASDTWPFFLDSAPTEAEIHQRLAAGDFFGAGEENFWIRDADGDLIGLIEIYQLDDLAPMFSLRLKTRYRRLGLGKPVLGWLTDYIFKNYPDKRRIEGQTREDNIPMRKLFNKCGYRKEAYYRQASPTESGGRVASVGYGILREDWASGKTTPVSWEKDPFFSGDLG